MDSRLLSSFQSLAFPDRSIPDLESHLKYFTPIILPGRNGQFSRGLNIAASPLPPETALRSLRRLLERRHIPLKEDGIPLRIVRDSSLISEEFDLQITEKSVILTVSDECGARYGIYELEELISCHDSREPLVIHRHQKPYITRRITRSFLTPNTRPPLCLDELDDDVDYYPDEYLDRLAHERMNGIWITVYLNDMPCSLFPEHGKEAPKKLGKLRKIVEKCGRYGIKCYLFMAEPRLIGEGWKNFTAEEGELCPEIKGFQDFPGQSCFCTSTPEGQAYLSETVGYIFKTVPGLGGMINIMCLESAFPCATWRMYSHIRKCTCPRCSGRSQEELFNEIAAVMAKAMRQYQPDGEFIGWFYAACYYPGALENENLLKISEHWPSDLSLMRNCETGGENLQLGKIRYVQDYSLSYGHLSEPWKKFAEVCGGSPAAKIQTCNSHEDASVPYLPVPGNLFSIYDELRRTRCRTVMQCWYFGNYPGIMNRAAGRLSFLPFPENESEFLTELARPAWGDRAEAVAECWRKFSEAFRLFPENLYFKWFGPLHHSIVFPWYLFPADLPMAPGYTQAFPTNSGDRIGELIGYTHDFAEIRTLLNEMDRLWQEAESIYRTLSRTPEQATETRLAEAVGLQISSSRRLFEFYRLREEMIYRKTDHLPAMRRLVGEEIAATARMAELCELDHRLGYHSEVESYLFFPEKLRLREKLLQNLLEEDFPKFSWNAPEILAYTGECRGSDSVTAGTSARNPARIHLKGTDTEIYLENNSLTFCFRNIETQVRLDFEPGRLCKIISLTATAGPENSLPVSNQEGISCDREGNGISIHFDLKAFDRWRPFPKCPVRFNLSCGPGDAVHLLHPQPYRLCMGDVNPADLIFLYLE